MSCSPCAGRVIPTIASSQGSYLSLSFFWLSLGVALDLGRMVSLAPHLGIPLPSVCLFNTARYIYYLYQLKPDKVFKRLFKVTLRSECHGGIWSKSTWKLMFSP